MVGGKQCYDYMSSALEFFRLNISHIDSLCVLKIKLRSIFFDLFLFILSSIYLDRNDGCWQTFGVIGNFTNLRPFQ